MTYRASSSRSAVGPAALRRARDLLSAKKEPVADAVLACRSGVGFTDELRELAASDPRVLLVSLRDLYG